MGPEESCRLLNVQPPSLAGCATIAQAKERLEAWRFGDLKRAYKSAAKIAHPDLAGGSEEKMKAVSAACAVIRDGLQIEAPKQPPISRMSARQGFASATSATAFGFGSVRIIIY